MLTQRGCQHLYLLFCQECKMPDVAGDKGVHFGGNGDFNKGQVGWIGNFFHGYIQTSGFHGLADP